MRFKKQRFKTGVALWDIHYPEHDGPSLDIAYEFCIDVQPDYLIYGGDQMSLDTISFFNRGKPKNVEGKRLKLEYEGFQMDVLDRFERILPDHCKKYFFIGNHEYRAERYIESSPVLEGSIEPEANLNLDKYEIIPYNGHLSIGKMNFIHGYCWNKYHAHKTLGAFEDNIFYGHVHSPQTYTKTTQLQNLPKQAVCVGCMCNRNPSYNRGKPNHWMKQFLYFYIFSSGMFFYYLVNIIEGKAVINGKLYGGK